MGGTFVPALRGDSSQNGTEHPWRRTASGRILSSMARGDGRPMEARQVRPGGHGPPERHLHQLVSEHPHFEVFPESILDGFAFRYLPNALAERQLSPELERRLDELNETVAEAMRRHGLAVLRTTLRGRVALRMSISSTLEQDVEATFEALAGLGRRLAVEAGLGEACKDPAPVTGNP